MPVAQSILDEALMNFDATLEVQETAAKSVKFSIRDTIKKGSISVAGIY